MPLTRNVSGDFLPIGESNTSDLTQGGVRLLGSHRLDLQADAPFLRAAFQQRCIALGTLPLARLSNQLINRWHRVRQKQMGSVNVNRPLYCTLGVPSSDGIRRAH